MKWPKLGRRRQRSLNERERVVNKTRPKITIIDREKGTVVIVTPRARKIKKILTPEQAKRLKEE